MVIDMHAHVGDYRWSPAEERGPMSLEALVARMDDEGIDRAAVLPVYNASPEQLPWAYLAHDGMSVREQVPAAARHPGRLIPFGTMDPRWAATPIAPTSPIISRDLAAAPAERRAIAALIEEMLATGEASEERFRAVGWHNGLMPQRQYLETRAEQGRISRESLDKILGGNAERLLKL